MRKLIIIGASGHGKVIADLGAQNGYKDIVFLDRNMLGECSGYPIVGKDTDVDAFDGDVFVAIGDALIRKRIMTEHESRVFPNLIHPKAIVADSVKIGKGTAVMAGAVLNPYAVIGNGCIINTLSSIDHDCKVGDYCHVAVGAHLCGSVMVDEKTWIGAGATVINGIHICSNCIIGAGSVVVKNLEKKGTYMGVPAKLSCNRKTISEYN